MRAVSNSSVLIALASIGQLPLLRVRFPDGILVPPAVWNEVVETGAGQPGAAEVAAAPWIVTHAVEDETRISLLRAELDAGEAEAIALAWEIGNAPVLPDERDARRVAHRLGLAVRGTVGVLIWGRRTGHVPNLRAALEALQTRARFRLGQAVYASALWAVGEL